MGGDSWASVVAHQEAFGRTDALTAALANGPPHRNVTESLCPHPTVDDKFNLHTLKTTVITVCGSISIGYAKQSGMTHLTFEGSHSLHLRTKS